ncbi:hypothetical protein KCP71_00095 [Salmonella enterica subsp. enterica]|nr:hypothetical protein KCP71_00095 [Salmonella enterica subsp. enterica]
MPPTSIMSGRETTSKSEGEMLTHSYGSAAQPRQSGAGEGISTILSRPVIPSRWKTIPLPKSIRIPADADLAVCAGQRAAQRAGPALTFSTRFEPHPTCEVFRPQRTVSKPTPKGRTSPARRARKNLDGSVRAGKGG